MNRLKYIIKYIFWDVPAILLAHCFYSRKWCNFDRIDPHMLVRMGFMQRILGFNRSVPWPVHHSSVVSGWKNIKLKTLPPYAGYSGGTYIQAGSSISFGENVLLAPGVKIISQNHDFTDYELHTKAKPIIIGNNCWIGANAVILPGVELADHIIVAAGSIVTKNFPEGDCIIGGNPAKMIKKISSYTGSYHAFVFMEENN